MASVRALPKVIEKSPKIRPPGSREHGLTLSAERRGFLTILRNC
jgi:hypothetical protein